MNALLTQLKNLGPMRLAALAGVGVGLLAFIIYFATRFTATPMELLYGNLEAVDSNRIVQELEAQNIPYELRNGGADIYVGADQVLRQRVSLAEFATGGATVGYEVFDEMDSLGATNFMQNVNLVRALEGELARTVAAIDSVKAARVHLVMPKRELFSRETQEPSASIYIKMKTGRLDQGQVNAIQQLVAAAVPQLKPSRISIVDEAGTLLSRNFEDDGDMLAFTREEMRLKTEQRLARNIEQLLEQTVGPGKARAEVRADMDFDRTVTEEEIFDPESAVPRSTVNLEEQAQTRENDPGAVTVQNNLPDANLNAGGPTATSSESRTEETVNYEISKRVVNSVSDGGEIERLSIAVLVDGTYDVAEDGTRTYVPRSDEQMDKIATLVRSAVGYDAQRGDQVEVINMRFTSLDDFMPEDAWTFMGFTKDEIMKMAEGLGIAIVAILVILLVVRPLVTRAFESAAPDEADMLSADAAAGVPQLTGPGSMPVPVDEEMEADELIDIDKVEGRVRASSLRKIGEIVDKHPEEALSIIRNWLYQEA
ncbi:Flagellar M-ring protein FliF [Caenispirillum salinarum AK4]|uniref:Flagellar M-ring protein n=1 Tax=Caenispirillum salinarum AK4 TaxID=1238182 RepID=K9GKJ8_9PROT|nr:flagellar basal-body MS-ring/collar protein FliF [Caenispirillum salinarum]EKV26550.1 Flagellar M-ring protein FliF [Caenispirillum salinarum AK4]